jgi:alkylation response protein AidB-like acyl-CoA dehydrogenase
MTDTAAMTQAGALAALLGAVRERHGEFAARQAVSPDVVDLMKAAGVYRALVARRFGGEERTPSEFLRLIEEISIADGSSGWVASFGFSAVYLSALPVATLAELYAKTPDVVFAGGIYPPQHAPPAPGGVSVSGRWSWGSGCTCADVVGVGIKTDAASGGGLPRIAVMPRERVRIEANWDVNGLKGTGSHDIVVENVVVPLEWTFVRGGGSSLETPLFRYPTMALAAQVLAVVGLGIARAALDEITGIATGRTSITGAPVLADRAYVQTDIAKQEAALRSARAFFYEVTDEAFAALDAGAPELDRRQITALRLASTHAARVGADVAFAAYTLSGTTGIFSASPIGRFMQDAIVVPQHAFLSEGTWQNAGRVLLGLDTPPGFP